MNSEALKTWMILIVLITALLISCKDTEAAGADTDSRAEQVKGCSLERTSPCCQAEKEANPCPCPAGNTNPSCTTEGCGKETNLCTANCKQNNQQATLCPVDRKQIKKNLYVDIVGVRLYACSEGCLKKVKQKDFITEELTKMRYVPEQLPINRSHGWTTGEVLRDMVLIERGELVRPSKYYVYGQDNPVEGDRYIVKLGRFYVDRYEVTNEDYCKFLNDDNEEYWTPWYGKIKRDKEGRFVPARADFARIPVTCVNYYQARGYAEWAGKRLPSEAEWEYAAGGGQGRKYPWGNEEPDETRANYGGKFGGLKPVSSFPKGQTHEGLFNLAGNIGEWCADYYDEDYYRKAPPENLISNLRGPESGYLRVYRGGHRGDNAVGLLVTTRHSRPPLLSDENLGLRCYISALATQATDQRVVAATSASERAEQAAKLHNIGDIEQLRSAFNQAKDLPRLVLLLSPTCSVCVNGARWVQKEILAKYPDSPLKVYAIWLPMLADDSRSRWRQDLLTDSRVTHFWDDDRLLGRFFAKLSNPPPRGGVQWDAFFVYGPQASWDKTPAPLRSFGRPVMRTREKLRASLVSLLKGKGEPSKDGDKAKCRAGEDKGKCCVGTDNSAVCKNGDVAKCCANKDKSTCKAGDKAKCGSGKGKCCPDSKAGSAKKPDAVKNTENKKPLPALTNGEKKILKSWKSWFYRPHG